MVQIVRFPALIAAVAALTPACSAPLRESEPSDRARKPAANRPEKPVTNAPIPLNQRFATLDEYLAFRAQGATIGKAWYREIRPGVYRLETGNYHGPAVEDRLFTREELMRKYGFTR